MTEATQSAQKALVILGMHRSGTSALTRVLNLLGVELGKGMLPPNDANPRGYWEHRQIYHAHEAMLNSIGRVWHSIFSFPEEWWLDPVIAPYQEKLVDIIRSEFSGAELWGFKDPRLCRLIPAWHSVFSEVGCEPHFVYVIRHPLEVAHSLHRRDGFSWEKCFRLWLLHTLESERECRIYPRIFVTYDQVLDDWRSSVDRISEGFRLEWPNSTLDVEREVSAFLDPDLRHHHKPAKLTIQDPLLAELVEVMYEELLRASNGEKAPSVELLSSVEARLEEETRTLDAAFLTEELLSLSGRLREAQGWVDSLERERARLEISAAQLERVLHSMSWKITAPLRKIHDLIRGNPINS